MTQLEQARKLGALLQQLAQLDPEADADERRAKPEVSEDEEDDLVLIDLDIGRFIVKREAGTVHRLKSYGTPLRNVAYPSLAAAIAEHEAKLKALKKGEAVEVTPTLDGWRIEKAKTGRGSCRTCGQAIAEGELRFGQDRKTATWFHLRCAAEGAPRAFRPFAEKAAQLGGAATPAVASAKKRTAPPPAMISALQKNPDDAKAMRVFADWLQSNGDPWGELIALELEKKTKDAGSHFRTHAADLSGGFGLRHLQWKRGFINMATLEGKSVEALLPQVKSFFALRTAMLTREFSVEVLPNAALFTAISQSALPTVKILHAYAGPGLEALAMPQLERLGLRVRNSPKGLEGLFDAKAPKLKRLSFMGKRGGQGELGGKDVLSLDFLRALFDSKFVRQLDSLELDFGAIDDAGAALIFEHRKKLQHLKRASFAAGFGPVRDKLSKAFAAQSEANGRAFDRETHHYESLRVYR